MVKLTAEDVFTPGGYPEHTYVPRDDSRQEQELRDGLRTLGFVISIAGPSKSGKTVLVERVVGKDYLIPVSGAEIHRGADLWDLVLNWMGTPSSTTYSVGGSSTVGAAIEGGGKVGVPLVAEGEAKASANVSGTVQGERGTEHARHGMRQVIKEIAKSDYVIFIDDFHYMPSEAQHEVARQIKEAVRAGVKVCTASVPHRTDDVVRANPELRGQVLNVAIEYWNERDLARIAVTGFEKLNAWIDEDSVAFFVRECAGSPQLMQAMCLHAARIVGVREASDETQGFGLSENDRREVCNRTARTINFYSLVSALDDGPKVRGQPRNSYALRRGGSGDVYRCLLLAVAADPPRLSFPYPEIVSRVGQVCANEQPSGSSLITSCQQWQKLAEERFPDERVIDWAEGNDQLDITEPYFLFYLRWSDWLQKQ